MRHPILKGLVVLAWIATALVYIVVIVLKVTQRGEDWWENFIDSPNARILIWVMMALPYAAAFLSLIYYLKSKKARPE